MADILEEIRDADEYDTNGWDKIRREAKKDMQFVSGDPWDANDKTQRKNRPTVAPEEMGQYFNQVINALRANPRGMRFAPNGNGANDKGAEFYQNKFREIEYRSHASVAYITAAENAIQRSYGFLRVDVDYASPRSANQEIWIRPFPNPDMVLPDTDALRPDASDMKHCFVYEWMKQSEFKRQYPDAKITNFGDSKVMAPKWVQGDRIRRSEYWTIKTRPRKLLLVQPPAPPAPPSMPPPSGMPLPPGIRPGQPPAPPEPREMFADEYQPSMGGKVIRELRTVQYPEVFMYLTNGVEILHEQKWLGKYIPIVACYGKVIYIEGDEGMERQILSMTRFGRDPWKAYCYACSQELEVLAMVPKAPLMMAEGQMDANQLRDLQKSMHEPLAALTYKPTTPATGAQVLAAPARLAYVAGEYLQSLEVVKEGFRRAIQAAMGSNFLPTQAQRRNEKSGIALNKIDQVAAQGTYHFVNSYEDLIRQTGVICEDLIDKIYDYRGQTGVMEADGVAQSVPINDPTNPKAINTTGDYLGTVSSAPSSDSEREAAADFMGMLVGNLQMVAQVSGPKAAAAVLARSIRMRNLGPEGDQVADIIEPPEFKQQQGQQGPPPPELLQLQQENQQLKEVLQRAAQEKQAKVVEQQGKFAIAQMQEDAESQRAAADREVKLAVAELSAKIERLALFMEESRLVGERIHASTQSAKDRLDGSIERAKDRVHEVNTALLDHATALAQADQSHQQALDQADQATAAASQLAAQQSDLSAQQPDTSAP